MKVCVVVVIAAIRRRRQLIKPFGDIQGDEDERRR